VDQRRLFASITPGDFGVERTYTARVSESEQRKDGAAEPLTHLDEAGRARMVDVSAKVETAREAVARAVVDLGPDLVERLFRGDLPKGEAIGVARIAAIQGAKETSRLIPLCHPIPLSGIEVSIERCSEGAVEVRVTARCRGVTGVEMEALTGAMAGALTIYDMCKAVEKGIRIGPVELLRKEGGKSGPWERTPDGA
jgi:cyclic pyranopterin phosphate synthase